jgi:pilus assembly protein CpaF
MRDSENVAPSPKNTAPTEAPRNGDKNMHSPKKDIVPNFGPLEPLLADEAVTEIMVNGPSHVYIEKGGRVYETDIEFEDDAQVMQLIEQIIHPLGRRIDRKRPMVDARLPDGSRVNAVIPPSAIDGPTITIRKFAKEKLTIDDLIQFGSLNSKVAEFLNACGRAP